MLHITHIDTALDWRGGQQSLLTLARGLRDRGHRQTIVCPADGALAERLRSDGFPIANRPPRETQIVHAHSGHAHNFAIRSTLLGNAKRVVTRHVAFAPKQALVHRLKYTWTCDAIIAVSAPVRRVLIAAGIPDTMITVIHTGIELPPPAPPPERSGPLVVGHMGAFTAEKGQDIVIEAARLLPAVRFILAGDGPLRDPLRASAPANVDFPGFLADRAAFYRSLDLFIMPSRSEAWGLAALEALAYGIPVIASDIEGLREFVPLRVPANDPPALADAIRAATRESLAAHAADARRIAEPFSVAAMAEQTEALYLRILNPARQE